LTFPNLLITIPYNNPPYTFKSIIHQDDTTQTGSGFILMLESGEETLQSEEQSDMCVTEVLVEGTESSLHDYFVSEGLVQLYYKKRDEARQTSSHPQTNVEFWGPNTINTNLDSTKKVQVQEMLNRYREAFGEVAGCFQQPVFKALLKTGAKPRAEPCPRFTSAIARFIKEVSDEKVKHQLAERASNQCEWAARLVLVAKYEEGKDTGPVNTRELKGLRCTTDCRYTNDQELDVVSDLPRPDEFRDSCAGNMYNTSLDLCDGFGHVQTEESSRDVYAYWTPYGLFRPTRMPQGNKRAADFFQRAMNSNFAPHIPEWGMKVKSYLDDIYLNHNVWEEHLNMLRAVLETTIKVGAKLNINKSRIGYHILDCLGS